MSDLRVMPVSQPRSQHPGRDVTATVVSALATALLGTVTHRSGADISIPWGIVVAFGLLGFSAWLARRRSGAVGVGTHLIIASLAIWWLAVTMGPGGDVLVPTGSKAFVTFFSQNAGYIWLFGSIVIQLVVLLVPARFFNRHITPQSTQSAAEEHV